MGRPLGQLLLHNIKAIHRTAELNTAFPVSPLLTTQIEGPRASLKFLIDLLPNKSRHNKPGLCFGASELQPHCASNLPELCPCKTLQQERHTTKGKDQTHTEYLGWNWQILVMRSFPFFSDSFLPPLPEWLHGTSKLFNVVTPVLQPTLSYSVKAKQ